MTNTKRNTATDKVVAINSLYCYLRVSTQSQIDDGSSIDNQRATGQRVAKRLGLTYVEMNEGACSSRTDVTRPVYENIKSRITSGEIRHLWVMNRTRWNRDMMEDMMTRNHYFLPNKLKFYEEDSGQERKYDEPQELMIDNILTSLGQFTRDNTRKLSVMGKRHLSRAEGKNSPFMGGTVNFGFDVVDKKWVVNKQEAKYVKKIFSMYLQGKSMQDIKSYLDSNGVSPRRSQLWNIGTILTMLKNRVYLGEYQWVAGGKKNIDKGGEVFTIHFEQIITHSMFNRVRKKIDRNTRNKGNNTRQYESLLSDFMRCYCGENISGVVKKRANSKRAEQKVYKCNSKMNSWKGKGVNECNNRRNMNMDRTNEFVVKQIKEVMGNSSILKDKFKTDVMSQKSIDSSQIELEKKMRENKIVRLNNQLDIMVQSISSNEVSYMLKKTEDVIYKEIKIKLEIEKAKCEDLKSKYIEEINELDNKKDWIEWITKYGDDISKKFEKPTTELFEGMIDSIVVNPTFEMNRDEIEKQVGHKLVINFMQPIVDDGIEYLTDVKSDGYNVVNGKKKLDIGKIDIQKGGRGNTTKKNLRN